MNPSQVAVCAVALAACSMMNADPCQSQVRVEVTTSAAAYLPKTYLAQTPQPNVGCNADWLGCSEATVLDNATERPAGMVGAGLTAWFGKRFGAQLSFGYAASAVQLSENSFAYYPNPSPHTTSDSRVLGDTSEHVLTATAELLTLFTPRLARAAVYAIAGLSIINHSGAAYAVMNADAARYGSTGSTDVGPVLGLGTRVRLAQSVSGRAEIRDYLFATGPGAEFVHLKGNLVLSLGLAATIARHGL